VQGDYQQKISAALVGAEMPQSHDRHFRKASLSGSLNTRMAINELAIVIDADGGNHPKALDALSYERYLLL
jgi:hypothetical protein